MQQTYKDDVPVEWSRGQYGITTWDFFLKPSLKVGYSILLSVSYASDVGFFYCSGIFLLVLFAHWKL